MAEPYIELPSRDRSPAELERDTIDALDMMNAGLMAATVRVALAERDRYRLALEGIRDDVDGSGGSCRLLARVALDG